MYKEKYVQGKMSAFFIFEEVKLSTLYSRILFKEKEGKKERLLQKVHKFTIPCCFPFLGP